MRISDWSSDVCSSDLAERAIRLFDRLWCQCHSAGVRSHTAPRKTHRIAKDAGGGCRALQRRGRIADRMPARRCPSATEPHLSQIVSSMKDHVATGGFAFAGRGDDYAIYATVDGEIGDWRGGA